MDSWLTGCHFDQILFYADSVKQANVLRPDRYYSDIHFVTPYTNTLSIFDSRKKNHKNDFEVSSISLYRNPRHCDTVDGVNAPYVQKFLRQQIRLKEEMGTV